MRNYELTYFAIGVASTTMGWRTSATAGVIVTIFALSIGLKYLTQARDEYLTAKRK